MTRFEAKEAEWKDALADLEVLVLARGALGRATEVQERKVDELARALDVLRRSPKGSEEVEA